MREIDTGWVKPGTGGISPGGGGDIHAGDGGSAGIGDGGGGCVSLPVKDDVSEGFRD